MFPEEQIQTENVTENETADAPPGQGTAAPEGSEAALTEGAPASAAPAEVNPADKVESETDAASAPDTTRDDYDKAAGRKLFFEVQKMGGERVFEASKKMSDAFLNKTPQDFVKEISQYPKAFYPVRDQIVLDTIRSRPSHRRRGS